MSKTDDILYFVFLFQYTIKKLIRTSFNSYDNTGRTLSLLFKHNFVKEEKVGEIKSLTITKEGEEKLFETYPISKEIERHIREKNKGKNNKLRQIKIASIIQMLNRYIPNYIYDYYSLLNRKTTNQIRETKTRKEKIETIAEEIRKRKEKDKNSRCFLSVREMRDLDSTRFKNLPSVRASGIFQCETGTYIVYNHLNKRMRLYGGFETVFCETIQEIMAEKEIRSISFGMSYKALYDSIIGAENGEMNYILPSMFYTKQYYVPLTSDGAKQIQLYTIKDFHEKICNTVVFKENRKRAKNTIYDGITETGDIVFLGFECDYNAIITIHQNIHSIRAKSNVYIFCFPHQAAFYARLFGNRAYINTIDINSLLYSIKGGIQE